MIFLKVLRCNLKLTKMYKTTYPKRNFCINNYSSKLSSRSYGILGVGILSIVTFYGISFYHPVFAHTKKKREDDEYLSGLHLSGREKRFIKFASVEYDGQIYMTPQDFLESFVDEQPRDRLKRHILSENELEEIRNKIPTLKKGSSQLFRTLRDKGIISYTEYLFLLSVLTKPQSGFRIAFNMFDTDSNKKVDKNEFLVMEKVFSQSWKDKHGLNNQKLDSTLIDVEDFVDDAQGLQKKHMVDTMLLTHFFGKKGDNVLLYDDFKRFMENLQTEVLEMEFQQFAKGGSTISEMDFAKILLRYTHLDTNLCDIYLDRLLERIKIEKNIPPGISFDEFKVFCQFLNNLEDFTIAMRMYTLADHPISKDEFHRAVKICTGTNLSEHLVDTVFSIFDEDGDGHLSYREFIAIMRDRLNRGFKSSTKNEGWDAFKVCLKNEIKIKNQN
ncbi:calcium uptake protein 3, mitochondrial isoform X3 [Daktulosphaira vitifoliae]|uniref:calcium uptake protein 3, mitochondrial isoform X3 n=1 Tax=Daktulosphaira vitifoliae TaxID=58002 RepID=UPI0021AA9CB9|nr:calcium uptake protein 3, mitochondrial isoform X3 [Daktulosphaira vitifoliae]